MTTHVLFLKGCQGSGKSFFVKEFLKTNPTYKCVSRDSLRHMLASYQFTKENENLVTKLERQIMLSIIEEGFSLVIDKMNLNPHDFNSDKQYLNSICNEGVEFEVKEFPIELFTAIERDSKRDFVIGEDVIRKTWKKYEKDLNDMLERSRTKIEYDPNLPNAIICDVDSTLAIKGDRSPYDFSKVKEDKINAPIRNLINIFGNIAVNKKLPTTFIFSGRDDICEIETDEWLRANNVEFNSLIMRKTGDKRKDSIVKKEMWETYIRGKFNVLYWVDDRRQVIDMVRNELGITCLDVAGNNF